MTYSAVKILVVDDQPRLVEQLCEFLEDRGYRCVSCTNSQQAIEQFSEHPDIGLVLCDLDMPCLNGIRLIEALKQIGGKQHLFEAIMLTGLAEKKNVIRALRAGVADYYHKPVDLEELLEGVQRQERVLQERQRSLKQLGLLNEKLQYLAASIDDLYQDLDKARLHYDLLPAQEPAGPEHDTDVPALFAHLSPRQMEVARLVGKGQTNYQIACELGITENTVKLYVSQVLRQTHMHNRTQLALALGGTSV